MKLQHLCMGIIITVTLLFFTACSLMTLSFSMISTDGAKSSTESNTSSRIVNVGLALEVDREGTTISWNDYKIGTTSDNKPIYENYYEILRSYTDPWENFEKIGYQHDNPNKKSRSRLSHFDTVITTESPPVWYRIRFSYIERSGDEDYTKVVLSEAVSH